MAVQDVRQYSRNSGKSCWFWGCLIALIAGILGGGAFLLCCGGWAAMMGGLGLATAPVGKAAGAWVDAVAAGNMSEAGALTEGGEARAKDLATRLERQVGKPTGWTWNGINVSIENGSAKVTLPVETGGGVKPALFRMVQKGDAWLVVDVGEAPPESEESEESSQ